MNRRIITILLLTALIVGVGAGCKQKEDGSAEAGLPEISIGDWKGLTENITKQVADGLTNIKDSALRAINSEVENFMQEHNIPKDKAGEVIKLAKEWAKTALTVSGEIDKTKGSLKQWLSDHLDDITEPTSTTTE